MYECRYLCKYIPTFVCMYVLLFYTYMRECLHTCISLSLSVSLSLSLSLSHTHTHTHTHTSSHVRSRQVTSLSLVPEPRDQTLFVFSTQPAIYYWYIITLILMTGPKIIIRDMCLYTKEWTEGRKEMFYLTTHSTHFIYVYMASCIW